MARWRRATLWMLRAGEVLQRGAVAGAGQEADVDLEIVAQREADLVLAAGEQLVDQRQRGYVLDGGSDDVGLAGGAGDEEVEVAYGLAAAAQGAGGGDLVDAGEGADEGGDALGLVERLVDAEAAGVAAVVLDSFEQLGGELLAHAGKAGELAFASGGLESVDVADAERGPDERYGLRAHAGEAQELEHGGRYFVSSSSRRGMLPVSTSWQILPAMPLPMPGMASSCLGSDAASAASWVVCCSTASAARR